MNADFHGTEDQLEAYALGRLATSDPPGLEALEEHLMVCSNCRDRLDSVEAFMLAMKDASRPSSPPAPGQPAARYAVTPVPGTVTYL